MAVGDVQPEADTSRPENWSAWRERQKERLDAELAEIVDEFIPVDTYLSRVQDSETGEEYDVIDVSKIQKKLTEELLVDENQPWTRVSREKIVHVLFERHKNDCVLIPEQVLHNEFKPIPLFYCPRSVSDATNRVAIADADFQIPLWEMYNNRVLRGRDSVQPTRDGEDMSAFEARFALTLFHPKYADALRDTSDGKLYLKNPDYDWKNPESKKRLLFSQDLIRKYGLDFLVQRGKRAMRQGMEEELPNLLASGAINLNDVREITLSKKGEVMTKFSPKPVGKNAYVMLRGVNQYVGRRFEGCMVQPFGSDKALVFQEQGNRKVLVAIFNIVDKENASEVYVSKAGDQIPRANADKTQLKEIRYDRMFARVADAEGLAGELSEQRRIQIENEVTEVVGQLMESARQSEAFVRSELTNADETVVAEATTKVHSELLDQAKRAIITASEANDGTELLADLKSYAFDARTYVALMHTIGVEQMLTQPLEQVNALQLTETDRGTMRGLLRTNYESVYPGEDQKEFRDKVAAGLEQSFTQPNTNFYTLRNDEGQLVSFNRFDQHEDLSGRTILYFGSFNADPKYRGVGGTMLEHTIENQLQQCDAMQAHCDPESAISKKYIEDGFIATQTATVAGHFSFEIWRSKDSSEYLQTKQMSEGDLVDLAGKTMSLDDDFFVREVEPNDQFLELDSGLSFLLTRYFTVGVKTYAAFELNSALSKQFIALEVTTSTDESEVEIPKAA